MIIAELESLVRRIVREELARSALDTQQAVIAQLVARGAIAPRNRTDDTPETEADCEIAALPR